MSIGTTNNNPPPEPSPAKGFDWIHVVALIVAALLGGMQLKPSPSPVPTPPAPIVVPPAPAPQPKPDPTPTPIVIPPVITTGVTIVDAQGQPLGNSVNSGQMFVVTAPLGVTLTGVPTNSADADLIDVSDSKIVCTLRNGCKLQIVVTGASKPTIVSIQCNQAPQPPPTPNVDPTPAPKPQPSPAPLPTAKNVSIAIVEDQSAKSLAVAKMFSQFAEWHALSQSGVTWCRYDVRTNETGGKQFVGQLADKGIKPSGDTVGYVIYDRDTKATLARGVMNSIADVKGPVEAILGRSL